MELPLGGLAFLLTSLLSQQKDHSNDLKHEDQRNPDKKFRVAGFVAKQFHADQGADTAAKNGNTHQCGFRYAPGASFGFRLVHKHKKKTCCIDYDKVQKCDVFDHGQYFLSWR